MSKAAAQHSQSNLVLPLQNSVLLLPNSCASEVVLAGLSSAMSSNVVLGTMTWRDSDIPVVSFEGLLGEPLRSDYQLRQAVVLQGITAPDRLPHFAIVLSGMPHLRQMHEADMRLLDEPEEGLPDAVYCRVAVDGDTVLIPDWDVLESSVLDILFGEGSWSTDLDGDDAPPVPDVEEVLQAEDAQTDNDLAFTEEIQPDDGDANLESLLDAAVSELQMDAPESEGFLSDSDSWDEQEFEELELTDLELPGLELSDMESADSESEDLSAGSALENVDSEEDDLSDEPPLEFLSESPEFDAYLNEDDEDADDDEGPGLNN